MLSPQSRILESRQDAAFVEEPNVAVASDRLRLSFEPAGALSDAELALLWDIAKEVQYHPIRKSLWLPGAAPPSPCILISGWACRYRITSDGERQIMCLLLPGDFTVPPLEPRIPSSCGIIALTELETVNAKSFVDGIRVDPGYPTLARAAQHATHLQDVLLCEQIIRLTQQNAGERVLHLMFELRERLRWSGLTQGNDFPFPLTQETLANVLGLSAVHLNRTLQALRKTDKLKLGRRRATLPQHDQAQSTVLRFPATPLEHDRHMPTRP